MGIATIERTMYEVSNLFLLPVLLAIIVLFLYAFYTLGGFAAQYRQRRRGRVAFERISQEGVLLPVRGYALLGYAACRTNISLRDLELYALKMLEPARIATRVAPMLGLVGTMIPMGPALKALANGNIQGISENLIVAFTAVIFGLITASITFWVATVKKQWLLEELRLIEKVWEHHSQGQEQRVSEAGSADDKHQESHYAVA